VALLSTSEAIAAFLSSKQGRWSDNTFTWYNSIFAPFAAQFKILPTVPEPLEEFIGFPESEHQRWVRFRALRTLYIFLERRRDIPNPFDKIDPLSANEAPVIPLDDQEIERILALDLSPKDEALIHCLLTTGIRPGELRNLKPESILQNTIVLDGKTGVDRMPVKPEVRDLLLKVSNKGWIFEDGEGGPLSRDQVYRIIENILLRADVRDGKGGGRLFRHTFITRVYDQSGDPFLVQRLARHASLAMTKHYEHAALGSTVKKYDALDLSYGKKAQGPPGQIAAQGQELEISPAIEDLAPEAERQKDRNMVTGIGAPGENLFEEEVELGALEGGFLGEEAQMSFIIPEDGTIPTPPYTIREYAYRLEGKGGPQKCWRIIGKNGAWWPGDGKPHNFFNFDQATAKVRELWGKSSLTR
jgi:integrase